MQPPRLPVPLPGGRLSDSSGERFASIAAHRAPGCGLCRRRGRVDHRSERLRGGASEPGPAHRSGDRPAYSGVDRPTGTCPVLSGDAFGVSAACSPTVRPAVADNRAHQRVVGRSAGRCIAGHCPGLRHGPSRGVVLDAAGSPARSPARSSNGRVRSGSGRGRRCQKAASSGTAGRWRPRGAARQLRGKYRLPWAAARMNAEESPAARRSPAERPSRASQEMRGGADELTAGRSAYSPPGGERRTRRASRERG